MLSRHLTLWVSLLSTVAAGQTTLTGEVTSLNSPVEALPCRPTIACMAELVPRGFFEVEAGYGGKVSSGQLGHSAQLLVKYSVLDTVQLQLATNNVFVAGPASVARAFDGVIPGLKLLLNAQGAWMPSNALSVHLAIPTYAAPDAVQRTLDASAWWYISRDAGPFHIDLNFAVTVYDLRARPTAQGLTALAVSWALGKGWGVFSELYSTWGHAQAIPLDGGSLNGVSFAVADDFVIDVGGDIGWYWSTRAFTAFAGITFVPNGRSKGLMVAAPPVPPQHVFASRLR